jgi:hypothetical protein
LQGEIGTLISLFVKGTEGDKKLSAKLFLFNPCPSGAAALVIKNSVAKDSELKYQTSYPGKTQQRSES